MSKPPKTPPQQHTEGEDAAEEKTGAHRGDQADQEETARKGSTGRPPNAKR